MNEVYIYTHRHTHMDLNSLSTEKLKISEDNLNAIHYYWIFHKYTLKFSLVVTLVQITRLHKL